MTTPTLGFIGAGNMARSLIGGLLANGWSVDEIKASTASSHSAHTITQTFGIECSTDNVAVCEQADIVLLCVKPQLMREVVEACASAIRANTLIISVAAGITVEALQRWLGQPLPIVRAMPNTPAMIGLGATGLFANAQVFAEQKAQAAKLFDAVGLSVWVDDEAQINAITALSGSGPAYHFLLTELMTQTAIGLGLDEATAQTLSAQTALGAAQMVANSGLDPATLRQQVTSPNGTTHHAIETFLAGNLPQLVDKAMATAVQRAEQMTEQLSGEK